MFEGVKMATGPREVMVEWGNGFRVHVRSVSRREKMSISANVESGKSLRKKATTGFDAGAFVDGLCSAGLIGWDGLKNKHLMEIIEGVDAVEKPETEIEYTAEAKAEIIEKMNADFAGFLMQAIDQAEKIGVEQLKN